MVERIEFGHKGEADRVREKYGSALASVDDARSKTVKVDPSTPDRIVERVENEAFQSQTPGRGSAGMAELSKAERETLKKTSDTFTWEKYGFDAMRAKAALQRKGATEWMDFYEPGEGVGGAIRNLQASKQRSAESGASIGVGGQRTDEEEMSGLGRRQAQAGRMQAGQLESAKEPAFAGDDEAREFLREEAQYGGEPFDMAFAMREPFAIEGQGRDFERMQELHESRSARARALDEAKSATVTRDPFTWADDPTHYDFPGIDMPNPLDDHRRRPEKAQTVDNQEQAPIADSFNQWHDNPDEYDLPGVDTPTRKQERRAMDTGRFDHGYKGEPREPWPLEELFQY